MWSGCIGREVATLQDEIQFSVVPSTWLTFDLVADSGFVQPTSLLDDDRELMDAILERYKMIMPVEKERAKLSKFCRRLKRIFDRMVASSSPVVKKELAGDENCGASADSGPKCFLIDHYAIGSFRHDTMIRGDSVIDFVLVIDDRELNEIDLGGEHLIAMVSQRIVQLAEGQFAKGELKVDVLAGSYIRLDYRDGLYQAICYVLGIGKDDRFISPIDNLILTRSACCEHTGSLLNPYSRLLICVLKDVFKRFEGLRYLNSWLTDKLALYCSSTSQKKNKYPLTVAKCFRRTFQLIASGIFLSGACRDNATAPAFEFNKPEFLTEEQADIITTTGHWIDALLIVGGHRLVLGLEKPTQDEYGNWIFENIVFPLGLGDPNQFYVTDEQSQAPDPAEIEVTKAVSEPDKHENEQKLEKEEIKKEIDNNDVDFLMMEYLRRSKLRYAAEAAAKAAAGEKAYANKTKEDVTDDNCEDVSTRKRTLSSGEEQDDLAKKSKSGPNDEHQSL